MVELRNSSLILQLYSFSLFPLFSFFNYYHYYYYYRPDGVTFEVEGDQVASLQPRPKKGAIVTFAYDNYTQGCAPVNPKLVRLREDVSWDDVINDHLSQSPRPLILNGILPLFLSFLFLFFSFFLSFICFLFCFVSFAHVLFINC